MDWTEMTDPGFEERLKALGFRDEDEFKSMTLDVDLTDSVIYGMFKRWTMYDKSRDGLQNILTFQRGRDDGEKFKEMFEQDEPFDDGHGDSWPPW